MRLLSKPQAVTASFLLGKVLVKLFPKAKRLGAEVWGPYFVYRFISDHVVLNEQLMPLQEAFYQEAARGSKVESVEMVSSNAKELLKHQKQFELLKQLPEAESLISLLRSEDHYDLLSSAFSPLFEGKVFLSHVFSKPISSSKIKEYSIEIWGAFALDTQEIKKQKKIVKEHIENRPLKKGEKLKMIDKTPFQGLFLKRGVGFYKALKKLWEDQASHFHFEPLSFYPFDLEKSKSFICDQITPQKDLFQFFTWHLAPSKANSFLENEAFCQANSKFIFGACAQKKTLTLACNYCLKFLCKIFKILGFSYEVVFSSKSEALCWKDLAGDLEVECKEGFLEKNVLLTLNIKDQWERGIEAFSFKVSKVKEAFSVIAESLLSIEDLFFWMLQTHSEDEIKRLIG